jgi:hypothetical protein
MEILDAKDHDFACHCRRNDFCIFCPPAGGRFHRQSERDYDCCDGSDKHRRSETFIAETAAARMEPRSENGLAPT